MNSELTVDNRDLAEMNKYLEARVEALARRVKELETQLKLTEVPVR